MASSSSNLNSFYNFVSPYSGSDYIPANIPEQIISQSMRSSEVVLSYSDFHKIVKIKVSDLLCAPISNYSYNRPPDVKRCYDIAKYVCQTKRPMDTMFYVCYNNIKQSFDILDGIHRYKSLLIIKEENSKPLDLIEYSDYGNNNDAKSWLFDSFLLLNIRFNAREGEQIELFKSLNKSIPVSELYLRDSSREKLNIIETVVSNWQIKYFDHFSSKAKPNKPNINRDTFMTLLGVVYDKYNITDDNKDLLEHKINLANLSISNSLPRKLSSKIIDKCASTNCWLFVYTTEQLLKII